MVVGGRRNTVCFLANFLSLFIRTLLLTNGEAFDYPSTVKPPFSWTNHPSTDFNFWESAGERPILVNGSFVCGFHCKFEGTACLFAISILPSSFDENSNFSTQMVWSANRNKPIGLGAKLQFSQEGDLTLQNDHDTLVWSTNTTGKFVSGMKLTHQGNLILFDRNNEMVWQSFDHLTDSLVIGQRLVSGQKLVASISTTNWSEGLYSFSVDNRGYFVAFAALDATVVYCRSFWSQTRSQTGQFYAELTNMSFGLSSPLSFPGFGFSYIQLGSDGHLRSFGWVESNWKEKKDAVAQNPCISGQINPSQPSLGCYPDNPISCESPQWQRLLELKDTADPGLSSLNSLAYTRTDIESCKRACLKNCSCMYASFQPSDKNYSDLGYCFLRSDALSFKRVPAHLNQSLFLKVQSSPIAQIPQRNRSSPAEIPQRKKRQNVGVVVGSTLGVTFSVLLICTFFLLQINKDAKDVEEDYLGHISGAPMRFSYEELKVVTNNFSNKLGEGGFGCVFQGTLPGSAQVAVKCLDGFGPVKKSFMAEVETIGSIHHFNLVRLVGFCAEKLRMLLVYEYMCNGSLDQWIFCRDKALVLGWQRKRKIILDIAKGLAYLHEGCRQKIIHLDIKPQNILLDENFNAKVSDFGLSKLVGREQSQIVTTMRGTPGYMAPEWVNSVITEKADVYSFGIVVLEILCGRKNVDRSLPEKDALLVSLFKRKVEDDQLLDLADECNEEMQSNTAEIVEMMKVAAWCLQSEYARRPSMSIVVKFLEGKMDDENEYDFSNPPAPSEAETLGHQMDAAAVTASPLIPSILSGPR
ncbi:hypothetical protein SLEP1_g33121 [Rubroshorea leprosula]|uniref:Receptor-like serine/threonine-protein kinase n=1 Tax=Rubroshorea leprosula TaxID=152421 RepID=A0AAV5KFQ1_9ROSI|nr:hypothetical protein SLEP1_g33121 [Rubroshorea leprosula]